MVKIRDARTISPAAFAADQEDRVLAQIARVARDEKRLGIIRIPRGRKMVVIREDLTEYASVTEAAKANGINKADNICQAIRRKGRCAGWLWAYSGDVPETFHTGATPRGAYKADSTIDLPVAV